MFDFSPLYIFIHKIYSANAYIYQGILVDLSKKEVVIIYLPTSQIITVHIEFLVLVFRAHDLNSNWGQYGNNNRFQLVLMCCTLKTLQCGQAFLWIYCNTNV